MKGEQPMRKPWSHWRDWANVGLGAWLLLSPWLFTYSNRVATWNAWIVGGAIVAAGLWALAKPASPGAESANTALGSWVFFSPWFLSFASAASVAAWNAWAVGAGVAFDAAWRLSRVVAGAARRA